MQWTRYRSSRKWKPARRPFRRIKQKDEHAKIIVLSVQENVALARRVLKVGASGYLTKRIRPKDLINSVQTVHSDGTYIEHEVAQQIALFDARGDKDPLQQLSDREFEVFRLLSAGKSAKEIAEVIIDIPENG